MVSQQRVLQLLPRGEALPGWPLHHTPGVCVWVPSLGLLEHGLPVWGIGDLQRSLMRLWRLPSKMRDHLLHYCLILYKLTQWDEVQEWIMWLLAALSPPLSPYMLHGHLLFSSKSAAKIFSPQGRACRDQIEWGAVGLMCVSQWH